MFEKGAYRPVRLGREINRLLVEASASVVKHGSSVVGVENWQPCWWRPWSAVGERSGLGISLMQQRHRERMVVVTGRRRGRKRVGAGVAGRRVAEGQPAAQ
jgi:hypothetical protein